MTSPTLFPTPPATATAGFSSSRLRHPAVFGGGIIALAVLAFITWAALAPLSGAVVAMGLVKTELNRRAVQHPDGGIIKQLHVKDGDRVEAGQPVVELENISNDANHQMLREMAVFETLKRDRLDAEQQLAPRFGLDPETRKRYGDALVLPAYERELKIFQVRRTSLDQQLATLAAQLRAIEDERRFLQSRIQADTHGMRLVEQELAMNRALESQQFVAKTRLMGFERAMTDYQSRLGEHEVSLAQAEQRANDVKLQLAATQSDYQRLASEEYKESNNRLAELRERLRPAEDALQRQQISAPVSGTVVGSRFHAPAQVAGPREVLMEIVPDNESLVVEAQVSVDGINDLAIGQAADLRFTAFKSRTTPIVTGKVTYVSADALADPNGMPFFQVHIRPDPASLKAAKIDAIQPGMAAEVYILTEGRSALDYLLAPITDTLRQSMREQ
jgi:HlyD family type I secretion membrane fusion protein